MLCHNTCNGFLNRCCWRSHLDSNQSDRSEAFIRPQLDSPRLRFFNHGHSPRRREEEKLKCQSFAANINPSSPRSVITTHSRCRNAGDASPGRARPKPSTRSRQLQILLAQRAISRTYPAGLTKLTPPNGVGTSVVDNVERRGFYRAN